jgi:hypothetical protein
MLAEEESVVAEEEDEGVVERSLALQRLEQRPDALVHRSHHRGPLSNLLLSRAVQRPGSLKGG